LHVASLAAVLDTFLATVYRVPNVTTVPNSYVCLVQFPQSIKTLSRCRVTSVRTAPSPSDALATLVVRRGLSILSLSISLATDNSSQTHLS
jgi:hypothetical protein